MVSASPNLGRRFRNTSGIVNVHKFGIIPELHSKFPEDYVDVNTHNILQRIKPWAEIASPLRSQFMSSQTKTLQPIVIDKILVLCVDFPDRPASIPIETIYSRFFGDYQNSLKEYYREISYGKYSPYGEVHGWYRTTNLSTYYTDKQNGFGTYPMSAEKLVEDTIDIATNDPDIDWTSFDSNDNGYIDNLFVIHSGTEAAWTGDINDFWAHVWIIPEPKMIQGRYVWIYAITAEYLGKPGDPSSLANQAIGGDCHETGHLLGLPDLYDVTDLSNGVGAYSLMGSGSWGNMGMTPTHLDAWSKYILGFADAIEDPIGSQYIDNAETSPTIFKYTTNDPKQYFLVENRQKILYDKFLPSEGIFVWRIDENQIDNQMYNNDKSCFLVGLIQADNLKDLENRANNGDLGDPYPGIMNNRLFGRFTNPNSLLCNGQTQDLLISNISDSAKMMSFESTIPGPLAHAGLSPAQAIILTGLATGAIYEASKKSKIGK